MLYVVGIIIGLLILTLVVVLNELGHALVARKYGVVVEEFGVGFPPLAWGKKLKQSFLGKNVLFSVNWLPLGGFVRLKGEVDAADKKGDYGAATLWQKTQILLAGVTMNWLTAIVVFTILALVGMPKLYDGQFSVASDTRTVATPAVIERVVADSPATEAGLRAGDELKTIDGEKTTTLSQLSSALAQSSGESVEVVYVRDGAMQTATLTPRVIDGNAPQIGVYLRSSLEKYYATWSAPVVGVGVTAQITWLTLKGVGETLWSFVTGVIGMLNINEEARNDARDRVGQAGQNVAGPVGLVGQLVPAVVASGVSYILFLIGAISIALAVMNTLPIPALDGGRWFVTVLYRAILRKPLAPETEQAIHGNGMLVLLGLFVLITISDVTKFF